ncbi:unnamed protein product, partial [Schistosoma curassoni]
MVVASNQDPLYYVNLILLFEKCSFHTHEASVPTLLLKALLIQLSYDPNYLRRMICLASLHQLGEAQSCRSELLQKHLLPTIVQLGQDPVPNVRFKVGQILGKIGHLLDASTIQTFVKPTLEKLGSDTDPDVVYYAKESS